MEIDAKPYRETYERVETIVEHKGYKLYYEYNNDDEPHVFKILTEDMPKDQIDNLPAFLQMYVTTGNVDTRPYQLRPIEETEVPVFHITWVSTGDNYRGQGLALLILIYGICVLKEKFPHINYVTLDDDSQNNTSVKGNIYTRLGLDYIGLIELNILQQGELKISGPEKQLLLDNAFINRANSLLNNIGKKRRLAQTIEPTKTSEDYQTSKKSPSISGGKKYKSRSKRSMKYKKSKKSMKHKGKKTRRQIKRRS
jgi:hypothetical protein